MLVRRPLTIVFIAREILRLMDGLPWQKKGLYAFTSDVDIQVIESDLMLSVDDFAYRVAWPTIHGILNTRRGLSDATVIPPNLQIAETYRAFTIRASMERHGEDYRLRCWVSYDPPQTRSDIPLYNWLGAEAEAA